MKKFLIYWAAVVMAASSVFGTIQELADGDHVGVKSTDKLGFYGKTPVVRPANTSSAFSALQALGLIATGGADPIFIEQHVQVSLSAAQIIAMYTTPVQLVAAQGGTKSIVIDRVAFTITRTSTAFTGGGAVIVQYGSAANGAGTQSCDSTIAATVVTGAAGTTVTLRNGAIISDLAAATIQNAGLYISNATAVFAAGTGTATVDVWYFVY